MNRDDLRDYCLSKPAAVEDFPFGEEVAVMKVMGKMFALLPVGSSAQISLKCDPDWALILRQTYSAVTPGYHLNKQHWNSVDVDGTILDDELREMIDHSYNLVVKSLKKANREKLKEM
jgi:predicted DNA-binding protein (MmcQ/YjbR family)